jgi:hypothetical protein
MSLVHAASSRALQFTVKRHGDKLPLRIRTALIAGTAAALWAAALLACYYIATALV